MFNVKQPKKTQKEPEKWIDPLSKLERWFSRLPCGYIESKCYCGSGKPILYWSPDDGVGCEGCKGSLFIYIPVATMYNIMEEFNFPPELIKSVYEQINKN